MWGFLLVILCLILPINLLFIIIFLDDYDKSINGLNKDNTLGIVMGVREEIQIFVLALIAVINLITVFFSVLIDYQSKLRKRSMIIIEITTFGLMMADILARSCDGFNSVSGFLIVRISNFLTYLFIYVELISLNSYVHTFIDMKQKADVQAKKILNIISHIGILMLVISQANGMYYYFDDNNHYVRGDFFAISFIMPLIIIIVMFFAVVKHRKEMSIHIYVSGLIFTLLPLVCAIIQGIFFGTSLFNPSIGIAAIIMFALSLIDQNEVLRRTARIETMTGYLNTYGYIEKMHKIIKDKKIDRYTAFYFDIVRMGLINRKYGVPVGDEVIINFTKEVGKFMNDEELLGRLGGNFYTAIILKDRAKDFLDFLSAVKVPIHVRGEEQLITVSAVAGVYDIPDSNCTENQIMTNVAMAVNIAKNIQKKPYVYLTKELMQEMNEQRHLQEIIPSCMAQREFIPYYQPKIDLKTYNLCGAEALVRWKHEGELVVPYKFIPLMEQNESICGLDFYMLNAVCEDIKKWISEGVNPPVISVNFSRKNLGNPNLAEDIYSVVKKHDIPSELIQIEFTETIDEYDIYTLKNVVEGIQKYGMTTAIDDFGVGSSSISVLKEIPFDVLKIDKSFIDSINDKDRNILGHIIEMANEMEARTITEGVEKAEQVEVLKKLGCAEIQGFFFDKPLPKEVFEDRMSNPQYS